MNLTPTYKGAFLAGFCVWVLTWATLFKLDRVPYVGRYFDKEKWLDRINRNKGMTLLCTEAINFGVHGVARPESAIYAIGGTVWNVIMIMLYLPYRQRRRLREYGEDLLMRTDDQPKAKGAHAN